ncbi:MAG TPA: ABC transporter substrate-binding protein [Acidimicrobiales bacterium]|nr:ABC transporter substrate-binding protein [Acidimicrobiales bacterium]
MKNRRAGGSLLAMLAAASLAVAGLAAPAAAAAPGVTKKAVKVGFITDITGIASSTFEDSAQGIAARFALQNAHGGVNGRKLELVTADTTSTPAGAQTAAQDLVETKGVFAVAEVSALFFGAYHYLNQQGIPVVGTSLDGPEWYQQPNTNMFNIEGTNSPNYPSYTQWGKFWKATGAKKISIVMSQTPSSQRAGQQEINSIKAVGLQTCDDTVVPLGGVNFSAWALSFKNAGCDGAECSCVLSSSLAMATAIKNLGLTDVKIDFAAGPSQGVFANQATLSAAEGAYFPGTNFDPTYQKPASKAMLAALRKYDPSYKGGIPDLGLSDGWEVGDLFIKGLQVAGKNPTRQSFIANLRKVGNFDAGGLLPHPVSFRNFGQAPKQSCILSAHFVDGKYQAFPASGKPFCGTLIPNSNAS